MTSYRFKRRAFLGAAGGAVGLKVMFRNLEASGQTASSPPRFLYSMWPVGIVAGASEALWKPTSGTINGSPALKPFADAGLDADMTVIRGLTLVQGPPSCAGGDTRGLIKLATGVDPGSVCRASDTGGDDGIAVGPSIDQILLKNVAALQAPGARFANAICDSRVDTGEISAQCLSYSDATQAVTTRNGTTTAQNIPNFPTLSPLALYNSLFGSFVPGTCSTGGQGGGGSGGTGGTGGATQVAPAMLKQLVLRKSVLDYALEEVNQMKTLVPSGAKNRLDIHAQAIRDIEGQVNGTINNLLGPNSGGVAGRSGAGGGSGGAGGGSGGAGAGCPQCTFPSPPPDASGKSGSPGNQYGAGQDMGGSDDGPVHEQVAGLHMDILRAAMVCDLIRVATFQFSPATNHVAFGGLFPGDNRFFQHHPTSHRIGTADTLASSTVAGLTAVAQFLYNVEVWLFTRHANNLAKWKGQLDGYGNNLLDHTVVPFVTNIAACGHEQTNVPAMIIGGKALGFDHKQYVSGSYTVNQFFGTIGQTYGYTNAGPVGAPIPGLWTQPA